MPFVQTMWLASIAMGDEELPIPALADPATRDALGIYRRRSLRTLGIGVAALIVGSVAVQPNHGRPPAALSLVGLVSFTTALLALSGGITGCARARRMKHRLGRVGWTARCADYRIAPIGANGQPALLIQADAHGPEVVCSVSTTVRRYRRLPQGADRPLLVVGDPRRWAVVAPPDRSIVLVVKRPLLPWWARKLRKYATAS